MKRHVALVLVGAYAGSGMPLSGQDVVVRMANGTPVWGDAPTIVEELRIGSLLGAEEYSFGSIGDVLAHPDGTIWVGDSQLHAIRRYSSGGDYLGQVGREGEGPGEMKYVSNMRALSDGSVIVWDAGLIRVSRFRADGAFIDSFVPPTFMIAGSNEELEVDREDYIYLIAMTALTPVEGTVGERLLAASRQTRRAFWLKMDISGAILDSIFVEPSESVGASDVLFTQTLMSPLGYRIVARNDRYSITLEESSARTIEIRRDIEAVEFSRAELADAERMQSVMSDRNGRPVRDIPIEKPPFRRLHADSQGRLWIQLRTAGVFEVETPGERSAREDACEFFGATRDECDAGVREWHEELSFDVIGTDGRFFGRVDLPNHRTQLEHAADDVLWVTERGEYDEQYVVRYRVVPN